MTFEGVVADLPPPLLWQKTYYTPLHYAAADGKGDCLRALLAGGADINAKSKVSATIYQRRL